MAEKTVYEQLAAGIGQGDSKIVPDIFKKLADEKDECTGRDRHG